MHCVTTRFRVRRPWQMVGMYLAYRRMRHDLEAAPGLLRHAFLFQSPLACCTLSIWASQEALERFSKAPSHPVRYAKTVCSEIWSAYWRLDALSAYACDWRGRSEWPALVPDPEQPWRLVTVKETATSVERVTRGEELVTAPMGCGTTGSTWDRRGVIRIAR